MKLKIRCKHCVKPSIHMGFVYRWFVIVQISLIVAGCPAPTLKEDSKIEALTTKLNSIETIRPADLSDSTPISVEQATQEATEQVTDPNETIPVIQLTLEQVRAATLANNLDLKVDLIDPAIAQRSLDIERAKFEAAFFGSASYSTSETEEGVSSTSNDYEVGIDAPLYTDGTISVGIPFGESESDTSDGVADAAVSVSYIQSLLRGAGTRINTHSIRIAGYRKHITDAWTKQSIISLLAQADRAYWWLYMAQRQLDVARGQYEMAQKQLHHAERKVASGSAARIEIVRAEAGLSSTIEALIDTETMVQNRQLNLQRIMNRPDVPLDANIKIDPNSEPNPLGLDIDQEKLVDIALSNRMDTIRLELQLAMDGLDVELARNAMLPDLRFRYSYAAQTEAGEVAYALGDFGDKTSDTHSFSLSASIPLGNRVAKARLEQARLQKLQDEANYASQRQFIRQQVYESVREINNRWLRILAAEKNVETAYRDYQVEQSQFQLGYRTSTDVLLASTRFAEARLRRINALAGYEIAMIDLAQATGTLLGYGRIIIEPTDLPDMAYQAEVPKVKSD